MTGIYVQLADGFADNSDVIFHRSFKLVQPEFVFSLSNAILAFRIAAVEWVATGIERALGYVDVPDSVIYAAEVSILENTVITTARPFPGFIVIENDLLWRWVMKP